MQIRNHSQADKRSALAFGFVLAGALGIAWNLAGDDTARGTKAVTTASRSTPTKRVEYPSPPPALVASLLALHNSTRAKNGLSELQVHPKLTAAAQRYAEFASRTGQFGHESDGRSPADRITAEGLRIGSWAENMAWGQRTPEAAMATWLKSQVHHDNILSKHTHVGFGQAGKVWVTVFANPLERAR